MGLFQLLWVFVVSCCTSGVLCVCSSAYGAKPCSYVPVAAGETPACARPGMTFCEYPTQYPSHLVKHLVEAWMYDHGTLLLDESKYELKNYYPPTQKYGVNTYGPPQNNIHTEYQAEHNAGYGGSTFQGYPSNTYIPAPSRNHSYYQYNAPNNHQSGGHKYHSKSQYSEGGYSRYNQPQFFKPMRIPEVLTQHSGTWPRWGGNKYYTRRKRSLHMAHKLNSNTNDTETSARRKRQIGAPKALCDTNSNYIMPRAALNHQGNWMYVVNMPELDNRYTQLVKSETCASQQCNGLCLLPEDHTSRCEQKYVQKRLVALQPAGDQLYSDVFWFPSCCLCTITRNAAN